MNETSERKLDEFQEACRPAIEFLRKNYDPMCKIIISDDYCEVVVNNIGVPNEIKD